MTHAHDPAYPVPFDTEIAAKEGQGSRGLTKREAFAMAAMQGILANPDWRRIMRRPYEEVAQEAIQYADTTLAELAKGSP